MKNVGVPLTPARAPRRKSSRTRSMWTPVNISLMTRRASMPAAEAYWARFLSKRSSGRQNTVDCPIASEQPSRLDMLRRNVDIHNHHIQGGRKAHRSALEYGSRLASGRVSLGLVVVLTGSRFILSLP